MRFTTRTDLSASLEYVFEEISDFERFERLALRRGVRVERTFDSAPPSVGMGWKTEIDYRGRHRVVLLELTSFDPPNGLIIGFKSGGLSGSMILDLVPLSKWRTRIGVDLEIKPHTMPARILLQTLRLSKARTKERFQKRVFEFAQDIETGYRGLSG